jgi:predicted methyltransferase
MGTFHFHTGRQLTKRLRENTEPIDGLPDIAVASFAEAYRVLRPGGVLQSADIANTNPVPEEAKREIDLWTG